MDRRIAVIDADSFIYIAAWNHKETTEKSLVLATINEMMVEMIQNTKATHYIGVFTPSKTFRNRITETYKAKRPPTPDWVTKWKQTIIDYCVSEYGFVVAEDHEADDVLSIMRGPEMVLCHIDKDINQVPGEHYDYKKKVLYTVDDTAAEYNFWYQVLVGDTTDNIKGAWKIGPVNAAKILSEPNFTDKTSPDWKEDAYKFVVKETFKLKNGDTWEEDYKETVSLIRLLQPTPELTEKYRLHIQQVGIEAETDLVGDILNHDNRVSTDTERSHEGDILCPPVDIS